MGKSELEDFQKWFLSVNKLLHFIIKRYLDKSYFKDQNKLIIVVVGGRGRAKGRDGENGTR